MGTFLKQYLSSLSLLDPLRVKTFFVQQDGTANVRTFSLDADDLFYTVLHYVLLLETRVCFERQGIIDFQHCAGVSVDGCLEYVVI